MTQCNQPGGSAAKNLDSTSPQSTYIYINCILNVSIVCCSQSGHLIHNISFNLHYHASIHPSTVCQRKIVKVISMKNIISTDIIYKPWLW